MSEKQRNGRKLPFMLLMLLVLLVSVMFLFFETSEHTSNMSGSSSVSISDADLMLHHQPIIAVPIVSIADTNRDIVVKDNENQATTTQSQRIQDTKAEEKEKNGMRMRSNLSNRSNSSKPAQLITDYKILQIGFNKVGTSSLFAYFVTNKKSPICGTHYGMIICNDKFHNTKNPKDKRQIKINKYKIVEPHCLASLMSCTFARLIQVNEFDADYKCNMQQIENQEKQQKQDKEEEEQQPHVQLQRLIHLHDDAFYRCNNINKSTDFLDKFKDDNAFKLFDFGLIKQFEQIGQLSTKIRYFGDFSWAPTCYQIPCYRSPLNYTNYITKSGASNTATRVFSPYYGMIDNFYGIKYNIFNNIKYFEIIDKQYPSSKHNIKFILNLRHFLHYLRSKVLFSKYHFIKQGLRSFQFCKIEGQGCLHLDRMKLAWENNPSDIIDINVTNIYSHSTYKLDRETIQHWLVHYWMIEWYEHNCGVLKYFWIDSYLHSLIDKTRLIVFDIEKDSFKKLYNEFKYYHGLNLENVDKIKIELKTDMSKQIEIANERPSAYANVLLHLLEVIERYELKFPNHYELTVLTNSVCPKYFWYPDNPTFGKLFRSVSLWHPSTWKQLHDTSANY